MCYYILADSLVAKWKYSPDQMKHVDMDLRMQKILDEIDILKPDLLSIQEKQKDELKSIEMLKNKGYEVNLMFRDELLQV